MKKFAIFLLAVGAASSLIANIIDWELDNVTNPDGSTITKSYDIVFLTGGTVQDGKIVGGSTNNGENTSSVFDQGGFAYGTWEDEATSPATYFVALSSGGEYYAIYSGNNTESPLTYNYTASGSGLNPSLPGDSSESYAPDAPSGGFRTAVPVPEPATAVLALAGIAMLIRRRKA